MNSVGGAGDAGDLRVDGPGAAGHDARSRSRPTRPRRRRRRSRSRPTRAASRSSARSTRRSTTRSSLPCTSPQTYTDLIFGEHDFAVRAMDAHGQRRPDAGRVQLGGRRPGAAGRRSTSAPDARTDSRSATFEFSADGRDLRVRVRARRRGVHAVRLAEDLQQPAARAAHLPGPRVRRPRRPAEPPITTYTLVGRRARPARDDDPASRPPNPSDSTTASFAFESDEAAATFECSLDGAAFSACPVPSDFTGLDERLAHARSSARSTRPATSTPTPASYTWTVDGRPDAAGDDDHLRARRHDDARRRRLQLRLRAGRDVRVLARRRAVRRAARRRWSTATWRSATTRSASARPTEGQRRGAGELRLDDRARHDAAGDDAALRAGGHHDRDRRDVHASPRTSSRPSSSARSTARRSAAARRPTCTRS